jgi:predicted Zn-dependent protease
MQVLHAQEWKIFIADSLVKLASNNDELAFIIAHEIAHWENGDMINNLVKIPISTWQATDAECLADARAKDIVNKSGYIAKRVQNLLDRLKRKALRSNDSCDME